jgi:pimeloyl-ACP methyl ester carboxylesterase
MSELRFAELQIEHRNQVFNLSYFTREAKNETILYLHGMGSSKHDFLDARVVPELKDVSLVALDFPGCGRTPYGNGVSLEAHDLAQIVRKFTEKLRLKDFHLIGHSLGGIVGLLLCKENPDGVKSFVNIEGNLAPEDCFITRRIVEHSLEQLVARSFFRELELGYAQSPHAGVRIYADRFPKEISERVAFDYSNSLVRYSDGPDLLNWFTELAMPRLFVYGSANAHLSYLARLRTNGIRTVEVPNSHHWVLYDNPSFFYEVLAGFLQSSQD